jgi:hypothetical protein
MPRVETTIKEHDIVSLLHDCYTYGLKKGARGTVVHCYKDEWGFEVEFRVSPKEFKTVTLHHWEVKPEPFVNHITRMITLGNQNGKEMTFDAWVKECPLPKGFDPIHDGYPYWDQGMPLGWAIYQYEKKYKVKS